MEDSLVGCRRQEDHVLLEGAPPKGDRPGQFLPPRPPPTSSLACVTRPPSGGAGKVWETRQEKLDSSRNYRRETGTEASEDATQPIQTGVNLWIRYGIAAFDFFFSKNKFQH